MTASPTIAELRSIAEQVWSSYLNPDGASPLLPVLASNGARHVVASVSITGAWTGHVVLSCSNPAANAAAAALLGIEVDEVTEEDVSDALGELANILGGNVKALLPEPCALSLPRVLVEDARAVRYPGVTEVCLVDGSWIEEPVTIQVLESTVEVLGVRAA